MDLFDSLSPLLWFSRLFGLVQFPSDNSVTEKVIPFGRTLCSYSFFLYLATSISSVAGTVHHFKYTKELARKTVMDVFLISFWIICEQLIGMLCSSLYLYRSAKLNQLLVRLANFDLEINSIKHLLETKFRVKLQMLCFAIFIPIIFYLFSRIEHRTLLMKSLTTFWIVVILLLQSLTLNSFHCVTSRRRVLNRAVRELLLDRSSLSLHGRRSYLMRMTVFTLARLDQELSFATKEANEVFGAVLLAIVTFNMVDLTFVIFYMSEVFNSYSSAIDYLFQLIRIFLYLVGTILIAAAGEQLSRESPRKLILLNSLPCKVMQTGVLVSEVTLKARDVQSRRQLNLFSKQLQHTKIDITAKGFFTLNLGALKSMAAAVVSNVVILMQFQGMDPKCRCD